MQAEGKSWRGRDRWLYAATVLHGYGNVCAVGAICAMIRAYSNCRCPAHGEVAAWTAAKPSKPSGRSHLRRGFRGNERVGRLPHGKLLRPWCERAQACRPRTDVTAAQPRQREVEGCRPRHRQNEQEGARGCRDGGAGRPRGVGWRNAFRSVRRHRADGRITWGDTREIRHTFLRRPNRSLRRPPVRSLRPPMLHRDLQRCAWQTLYVDYDVSGVNGLAVVVGWSFV